MSLAPAASLPLAALGTHVTVEVGGTRASELSAALRRAWSRCVLESGEGPTVRLSLDEGDDLGELLPRATQEITRALIQARTGQLLMFHAGAVAHPKTGKSLVFVAPGGTGKTTLAGLLGRSYGYLSDETVAIDDDDRVLAYPKPLSQRPALAGPKQECSPDELGLLPAPGAPVVARVLLLERDDAHTGEPCVQEVGLLDGIELLAEQTSALYALPRGLHRLARLRETTGPLLHVRYAEADTLLSLTTDLIGAAS